MRHAQETAGLVLVVEDNRNISEMIGEYLEGRGFEVDYASDGLDGYRLAAENSYDVLVLDLMLPRLDGMEVCKKLRTEARKSTPVLMLTARDTLDDKLLGFDAGVDDYLVKPFALQEVEVRLQALCRRGRQRDDAGLFRCGALAYDAAARRASLNGVALSLPPKALRVLAELVRQPGRVFSRRELEIAVWGQEQASSDNLRSVLHTLRKALGADAELIRNMHGLGYSLDPGTPR